MKEKRRKKFPFTKKESIEIYNRLKKGESAKSLAKEYKTTKDYIYISSDVAENNGWV